MADDKEVKTPISKLAEVTSASEEDIMLLTKKNSSNVLETFKIKVGDFLATALKDYNNINVWMSEKIAELKKYVSEANFLKKNKDIEGGTHTKITYDANGLVTAGSDLLSSDIPGLNASAIVDGQFDEKRIKSGLNIDIAGSANKATYDGNDNVITSEYTTKKEFGELRDKCLTTENIDKTGLVTTDYLNKQNFVNNSSLTTTLTNYVTTKVLDSKGYIDNSSLTTTLTNYVTTKVLDSKGYVTKTTADSTYITPASADTKINEKLNSKFSDISKLLVVDSLPLKPDNTVLYFVKSSS